MERNSTFKSTPNFSFMFCVQIVVEAEDLFSGVLTDLGKVVDYNSDGDDHILTIFDYVEAMRCQL